MFIISQIIIFIATIKEKMSSAYICDIDYAEDICDIISKYIENPLELSTFATGGEINLKTIGIPAVSVNNVGRIAYPLCLPQAELLLKVATQAPFGKGTETIVDDNIRKVWQIDGNLVTVNRQWVDFLLPKIVADCCAKLGIDAQKMGVRASLYKMLLYEEGGHFKTHRDTEKEPGMFGSLLIQLPAEHEGGRLVVEHHGKVKYFDFSKESGDKAFYASFYADCEHMLEPVTSGMRLVLAFNLVRDVNSLSSLPSLNASEGFEDILASAARAWCDDVDGVEKYFYPLSHSYTKTNISFAGLKGKDLKVVDLLRNAVDPVTNEKLFTVWLALVTKHETGTEDEGWGYGGGGGMCTDADIDIEYSTDSWVGPDGNCDLNSLKLNFMTELITAARDDNEDEVEEQLREIFGDDPDKESREGYQGNYAGSLEYWYHSAVLVFYPAKKDFDIKLAVNTKLAVSLLEGMDRTGAEFADKFERLMKFISRGGGKWKVGQVLSLTRTIEQVQTVLSCCTKKVLNNFDIHGIVAVITKHGILNLKSELIGLLNSQSLDAMVSLLNLTKPNSNTSSTDVEAPAPASAVDQPVVAVTGLFHDLVTLLVVRILKVSLTTTSNGSAQTLCSTELVNVCRFVIENCNLETQIQVANNYGKGLPLQALNQLIQGLSTGIVDDEQMREFHHNLRQCAVSKCVKTPQVSSADVVAVVAMVDWVIRGSFNELMNTLIPKLMAMCDSDQLFRGLITLPSVLAELKTDSPICTHLQSVFNARIAVVAKKANPPPFSWCMPKLRDASRAGEFFAGPQQQTIVQGFNGIGHARNYVNKYSFVVDGVKCANATPAGTGARATVTIVKRKDYHDYLVKKSKDNLEELNNLRKIMRIHSIDSGVSSSNHDQLLPIEKKVKLDVAIAAPAANTTVSSKNISEPKMEIIDLTL